MAEPGESGRGRGRARGRGGRGGGRWSREFLWGAGPGPDMYDHPLDDFPIEGIEDFVGGRKLRPYDLRNESWPQCKCGQPSVVQMFDDYIDGGRRFFRCPFGYNSTDMGNCRFTKWVDPPHWDHVQDYINHLKNKIHDLECRVKSLEDEAEANALVVSIEGDPICPDTYCRCPYHPKPTWPPKSPSSAGAGYYDPGGPSHYYPNQFA